MHTMMLYAWPAQVNDWETGQPVLIKLDPLKAPADVAKDLYKVARKQDRTGDAIMPVIQARVLLPSCLITSHSISKTMPSRIRFPSLCRMYGHCARHVCSPNCCGLARGPCQGCTSDESSRELVLKALRTVLRHPGGGG